MKALLVITIAVSLAFAVFAVRSVGDGIERARGQRVAAMERAVRG